MKRGKNGNKFFPLVDAMKYKGIMACGDVLPGQPKLTDSM